MLNTISSKTFLKIFITTTVLMSLFAFEQTAQRITELGIVLWSSRWSFLLGIFALNVLGGLLLLRQISLENAPKWLEKFEFTNINRRLGFFLLLVGPPLFWIFRFYIFRGILPQLAPIFWVFLWASILQAVGLRLIRGYTLHFAFVLIILIHGLFFHVWASFTAVSEYPFSIGYSEASRHYYASLFDAKNLYGLHLPFPFLHPSRYMLLSLPFLISEVPFWFHRLWQSVLWISLTAVSSFLLIQRWSFKGWVKFFLFAWVYLYFLQGAVYYHLQVCVILILAGVSTRNLQLSLIFVVLASVWAGISRVNWFPVPAMLAIAIYLLETPLKDKGWRYWLFPFFCGLSGIGSAVGAQFLYINISGNADVSAFGSSFNSDLLWDRLLPNENFIGILLAIALVSSPLVFSLLRMVQGKTNKIHLLRWVALLFMLSILFLGGLVVSVKIGGGGDLHNMDAFMVLLILIVTSFFAEQVIDEHGKTPSWGRPSSSVIAAALLIPLGFAIPRVGSFYQYNETAAQKDIQTLQNYAEEALQNNGQVLFVTERQLFTFDELKGIPLIPEYEQIELMEMAMSGNRAYLESFYADLTSHRFAIIITESQKYTLRTKGRFVEEDNAWVQYVGAPLLCAYKPITSLTTTNIQIFIPRPSSPNCKNPFEK